MNMAYKFLGLLLIFQIIDVVTTYYLLNIGFTEGNFIVAFLIEHFNDIVGLSVLKIFTMILLFIYVPIAWVEHVWIRIAIYTVNMIYFLGCSMNISIILVEMFKSLK